MIGRNKQVIIIVMVLQHIPWENPHVTAARVMIKDGLLIAVSCHSRDFLIGPCCNAINILMTTSLVSLHFIAWIPLTYDGI